MWLSGQTANYTASNCPRQSIIPSIPDWVRAQPSQVPKPSKSRSSNLCYLLHRKLQERGILLPYCLGTTGLSPVNRVALLEYLLSAGVHRTNPPPNLPLSPLNRACQPLLRIIAIEPDLLSLPAKSFRYSTLSSNQPSSSAMASAIRPMLWRQVLSASARRPVSTSIPSAFLSKTPSQSNIVQNAARVAAFHASSRRSLLPPGPRT